MTLLTPDCVRPAERVRRFREAWALDAIGCTPISGWKPGDLAQRFERSTTIGSTIYLAFIPASETTCFFVGRGEYR